MASIGFPLLLIPVAICNIIAFLMPDLALSGPIPLFPITLMSKDIWMVTLNDLLVALSILLLWLEVMRAARPAPKYFTDHFLSLLVFGAAATEFVMLPKFGNATFFLITLTAMVDFLAGISLRARRPRRAAAPVYAPEPAPRYEPAPAPVAPTHPPAPVPAATSVAEAVLTDRPEPKVERIEPKLEPTPVPPEVVAHTSPQITSPDLQPGGVASPEDKPKT
ncbi:hypothetical protein [Tardiphaga sp. OK245]|uniref:hypothetical protein n=1 Tax=Tardiphaga sp. OK245 TaxID=1855306 RepID=UPI0008A721B6|nr:hypothetical protein [Tardiphaga sp. OK245]SEI17294.1 hypothetical protein SAMN05216367_4555 [Tardiphaga sp. OK245]